MARYVERAENLARILDINETFSRDSRGHQNWESVLQLYFDQDRFLEAYGEPAEGRVIWFYTLDKDNPTSIYSCLRMARENARTLRPLISTEMWIHLNVLFNRLRSLDRDALAPSHLTRFFASVKEGCQTHTGITEGTFYRDEGWCFYQIGRDLERADQVTRLLDVKYHLLLPSVEAVGSPLDVSQWNAVLRSAAAFHAFRRIHPSGMTSAAVAGFLLFNHRFPRSLHYCVEALAARIAQLRTDYRLRGGASTLHHLDNLRAVLAERSIDAIIADGLHEFVDEVQRELIAVSDELGNTFFGYNEVELVEAS